MATLLLGFEPSALTEAQVARVREGAPDLEVVVTKDRGEIEERLGEIEVVAGSFPRDLLTQAPNLRWFQQWGAGADWLLRYPEARSSDFILTNVSGIHAVPISEHVFALLLAFARALPTALRAQREHTWLDEDDVPVFELVDKTLLLVGVGEIGERIAALASAFGMTVWGVRNDPSKDAPNVSKMAGTESLRDLLPDADAVVLTVPLTEETRGMMGEGEFGAMKKSAYLINIGRGGVVDEGALIEALSEGRLAGAGLDVFEEEPLPETSPLWDMENVIVTSHYSGSSPRYTERAFKIFIDNVNRYRAGEPLHHVVDKERGY